MCLAVPGKIIEIFASPPPKWAKWILAVCLEKYAWKPFQKQLLDNMSLFTLVLP